MLSDDGNTGEVGQMKNVEGSQGIWESIQPEKLKHRVEAADGNAEHGYEQWNHLKNASTQLKCESGVVFGETLKEAEAILQMKNVRFHSK